MALKSVLDSLDDLAEPLREHYTEKDGKFYLDAEGMESEEAVAALRRSMDNAKKERAEFKKELDATVKKFKDIDPEKAREAQAKLLELEDKKLVDDGKIDELVAQRVQRAIDEAKASNEAMAKARDEALSETDTLKSQLSDVLIVNDLRRAAGDAKVRSTAVDDVLLRGKAVWHLEDGKPVPRVGDEMVYGKTGEQVTMTEWVEGLRSDAPHLFEGSSGGGALGDRGNANTGNGQPQQIDASQPNAIGENLEAIAAGKAQLVNI